jgi:hypothetical protein
MISRMQRARRAGPWSRKAIALVASVALALQALLLTFAPPVRTPASVAAHEQHAHAHHAQDGEARDRPAESPAHHAGLCCILASKLGTALGPVAAPPSLPAPDALRIALPPLHATAAIAARPRPGALGARAPPLVS